MYYDSKKLKCDNDELMTTVARTFLGLEKGRKTIWGNFRIEGDKLIYRTCETEEISGYKKDAKVNAAMKDLRLNRATFYQSESWRFSKSLTEIRAQLKKDEHVRFAIQRNVEDLIAIKINEKLIIGNSAVLPLIGRTVAYGNVSNNTGQTVIQRILNEHVPMVPFNVFEQAKLDLKKFRYIEKLPDETVKVKHQKTEGYGEHQKTKEWFEDRHFTGASLFEVDGKTFLFDIDRREIKHGLFNAFLVELPKRVETVKAAYELLKPKAVKDAELKGLEVKRQGEWFFVPCKAPKLPKLTEKQKLQVLVNEFVGAEVKKACGEKFIKKSRVIREKLRSALPRRLSLRAGQNRPNTVECGLQVQGKTFCTGTVKHEGREHADLRLNKWHVVFPNTSIRSFTITGDVD